MRSHDSYDAVTVDDLADVDYMIRERAYTSTRQLTGYVLNQWLCVRDQLEYVCPRCERRTHPLDSADYLCRECRYGP